MPGDELVLNPLLPAAFDALGNQELFETAVDLLVEVCQRDAFSETGIGRESEREKERERERGREGGEQQQRHRS